MVEHTPGPWSFDGPRSNIHVRQEIDPNMRVCFMTSDGPCRENARLIAAAPDMLAALRNVQKLISEAAMTGFNWKDGDWADRLFASQQVTSEAIRKATKPATTAGERG